MSGSLEFGWDQIWPLLRTYGMVPIGLVTLYYYGQYHFNTPDYALALDNGDTNKYLFKNSPLARLRSAAPPMFTTRRSWYRKAALEYVLALQAVFLLFTLCPDLVAYIASLEDWKVTLAANVSERAIWVLFALTGLLSSFPVFKDMDGWLLHRLHQKAAIPDDARLTASLLFDAPFAPDPAVVASVCQSLRSQHVKSVAAGECRGELERDWFRIRCLHEQLRLLVTEDRYRAFRRKFDGELDEMAEAVEYHREKLYDFFMRQQAAIPPEVHDIDAFYDENRGRPQLRTAQERREKLVFQTRALTYRLCLLSSLLVYACEDDVVGMETTFRRLGFEVRVPPIPRISWDAMLLVAVCIFAVVLVPSCVYSMLLGSAPQSGADAARLIPPDLAHATFWAFVAVVLHGSALVVAAWVKRRFARRAGERAGTRQNKLSECFVGALAAGLAAALLQQLIALLRLGPDYRLVLSAWPLLPAMTGFFVGLYMDRETEGRPVSDALTALHALSMAAVGMMIAVATTTDSSRVAEWPSYVRAFALYVGVIGAAIGLVTGYFFQRAHRQPAAAPSSPPLALLEERPTA